VPDASFLGISSSEFLQVAGALLTTTAAFVFLFLLNVPIKKLPLFAEYSNYEPPSWLVPWFAGVSLLLLTASASSGLFLRYLHSTPSETDFLAQYYETLTPFEIPDGYGALVNANMTITTAEGNFGIYVNGWRVFSSEVNCGLEFLCKTDAEWLRNEQRWRAEIDSLPELWDTYYTKNVLYRLPYTLSIMQWLVPGDNFIDIHTASPGMGACNLEGRLALNFQSKQLPYLFVSNLATGRANALRYRTNPIAANHGICNRIRLNITLPRKALR
jgi:hypothetical protein